MDMPKEVERFLPDLNVGVSSPNLMKTKKAPIFNELLPYIAQGALVPMGDNTFMVQAAHSRGGNCTIATLSAYLGAEGKVVEAHVEDFVINGAISEIEEVLRQISRIKYGMPVDLDTSDDLD